MPAPRSSEFRCRALDLVASGRRLGLLRCRSGRVQSPDPGLVDQRRIRSELAVDALDMTRWQRRPKHRHDCPRRPGHTRYYLREEIARARMAAHDVRDETPVRSRQLPGFCMPCDTSGHRFGRCRTE